MILMYEVNQSILLVSICGVRIASCILHLQYTLENIIIFNFGTFLLF